MLQEGRYSGRRDPTLRGQTSVTPSYSGIRILIGLQNGDFAKGILPPLLHYENAQNPSTHIRQHSPIDRPAAKLQDDIAHTEAERKCGL